MKVKFSIIAFLAVTSCLLLAFMLGGCGQSTPPAQTPAASGSASPAVTETGSVIKISWVADMNCSLCHGTEENSKIDGSLMGKHADLACGVCHTDEAALSGVHADVTASDSSTITSLKKTSVSEDTCIGCHGDYAALSENTLSVTILTDANGTVVTPPLVQTEVNANGQHDLITCADCHKMHSTEGADVAATASCLSCHHEDVYECGTCHD